MRSWHLNKYCFSFCPAVSIDSAWSRRSTGKLFQILASATAAARGSNLSGILSPDLCCLKSGDVSHSAPTGALLSATRTPASLRVGRVLQPQGMLNCWLMAENNIARRRAGYQHQADAAFRVRPTESVQSSVSEQNHPHHWLCTGQTRFQELIQLTQNRFYFRFPTNKAIYCLFKLEMRQLTMYCQLRPPDAMSSLT